MTPTFSTMVNCTVLEATYKIQKIELQSHLMNKTYEGHCINYPRKSQFRSSFEKLDKKKFSDEELPDIPSDLPKIGEKFTSENEKLKAHEAMQEILKIAKRDAYKHLRFFGIEKDKKSKYDEANYIHLNVQRNLPANAKMDENFCPDDDVDDIKAEDEPAKDIANYESDNDEDENEDRKIFESMNDEEADSSMIDRKIDDLYCCIDSDGNRLRKITKEDPENETLNFQSLSTTFNLPKVPNEIEEKVQRDGLCQNCPYLFVRNKSGSRQLVWKSSLVWLLREEAAKVSADRSSRFQGGGTKNSYDIRAFDEIKDVAKLNTLYVGDWCLFRKSAEYSENNCLIGKIVQFAQKFGDNLGRTGWKSIEYKGSYVDTSIDKRELGVLCQWYIIDSSNLSLKVAKLETHGYLEISRYELHIPQPDCNSIDENYGFLQDTTLKLNKNIYEKIKNFLDVQKE